MGASTSSWSCGACGVVVVFDVVASRRNDGLRVLASLPLRLAWMLSTSSSDRWKSECKLGFATPGGRFWFVDGQTGVSRQICSLGCLPQDPDFVPGVFGPVAQRYTLADLDRRESE